MNEEGQPSLRTRLRESDSGPWFDEAAIRLREFVRSKGGRIYSKALQHVHPSFAGLGVGFAHARGLLRAAGCFRDKSNGDDIVFGSPGDSHLPPYLEKAPSARVRKEEGGRALSVPDEEQARPVWKPRKRKPRRSEAQKFRLQADRLKALLHAKGRPMRLSKIRSLPLGSVFAGRDVEAVVGRAGLKSADIHGRTVIGRSPVDTSPLPYHAAALTPVEAGVLGGLLEAGSIRQDYMEEAFAYLAAFNSVSRALNRLIRCDYVSPGTNGEVSCLLSGAETFHALDPSEARNILERFKRHARESGFRERMDADRSRDRERADRIHKEMIRLVWPRPTEADRSGVSLDSCVIRMASSGDGTDLARLRKDIRVPEREIRASLARLSVCGLVRMTGPKENPSVRATEAAFMEGMPDFEVMLWMVALGLGRFCAETLVNVCRLGGTDLKSTAVENVLYGLQFRGHLVREGDGECFLTDSGRAFLNRVRERFHTLGGEHPVRIVALRAGDALARWTHRVREDGSLPSFMSMSAEGADEETAVLDWTFPPLPGDVREFGISGRWRGLLTEGGSLPERIMEELACGPMTAKGLAQCLAARERDICRALGFLASGRRVRDAAPGAGARSRAWRACCARVVELAGSGTDRIDARRVADGLPGVSEAETWAALCFVTDRGLVDKARWGSPPCPEIDAIEPSQAGRRLSRVKEPHPESSRARVLATLRDHPECVSGLVKALKIRDARIRQILRKLEKDGQAKLLKAKIKGSRGRLVSYWAATEYDDSGFAAVQQGLPACPLLTKAALLELLSSGSPWSLKNLAGAFGTRGQAVRDKLAEEIASGFITEFKGGMVVQKGPEKLTPDEIRFFGEPRFRTAAGFAVAAREINPRTLLLTLGMEMGEARRFLRKMKELGFAEAVPQHHEGPVKMTERGIRLCTAGIRLWHRAGPGGKPVC